MYQKEGIELSSDAISLCMDDIFEKEYAKEENDFYIYIPG
jgi:hypothetical protein